MKILLSSDWHLDAVTAGVARVSELDPYIDRMEATIEEERIDLVAFCGDAFDPGSMMQSYYTEKLMEAAIRLHRRARLGSIWIAGNHDVIETALGITTLSPLRVMADKVLTGDDLPMEVCEWPRALYFGCGDVNDVVVLALPYMAKAADTDPEVWRHAFDKAAHLREDDLPFRKGRGKLPLVVLGHLTVPGARLGSESREMARGRDVDFPAEVAKLKPALVANGHYHQAQTVGLGEMQIVVPGSPSRFTFGERHDDTKGFVVVEIDGA